MRKVRPMFQPVNVRPSNWNIHTHNKGDCTTRSMTYCLGGQLTYEQIEAEQYMYGEQMGTLRNATRVWSEVMKRRGYGWIQFDKRVVREVIATFFANYQHSFITLSRGHACAIDRGIVIDTWDSRGGRVYGILVKVEDIQFFKTSLLELGVEGRETDVPVPVQVRRRRRRFFW